MRVSVLWSELSGYLNVCLKTLVEQHQVDLQVFRIQRDQQDATFHAYADGLFSWMPELHTLTDGSLSNYAMLHEKVTEFQPDLLLISGWTQPAYLRLAKTLRHRGVRVICGGVDNQWQGTHKQWLGVLSSRLRVQPYFDALWVTGTRATHFAKRLGYSGDRLLTGFYACDYDRFSAIGQRRLAQTDTDHEVEDAWPHMFLFTGRLTTEKGVPDLLTAYRAYRTQVAQPWPLWIVGSGPLAPLVEEEADVRYLGFLQPEAYADLLGQAGVFILPSHVEPWGVVLQEAMCAALPVICSRQCGSSTELVREGKNGFAFMAGDSVQLCNLMVAVTRTEPQLRTMGMESFALAGRYRPTTWAQMLMTYSEMGN